MADIFKSDRSIKSEEQSDVNIKKEMFDLMELSVVVIKKNGEIVFTNESWRNYLSTQFSGNGEILVEKNYIKYISKIISDDALAHKYENFINKAISGKSKSHELTIPVNTKTDKRWINVQALPLKDDNRYTLLLHQDITDIKKIENQRTASELVFKVLIENMQDIIFTVGTDLRHTGVYGKWIEKTGKKENDFIGFRASEIFGKDIGKIHEDASKKALTGVSASYQWESVSPSGKKLHYQTTIAPIRDTDGNISGLVGLGRDITDLMDERNKAQISDKLKSTFLSSISHEIRTPLNAILGFSQLMMEHPGLNDDLREYANIIIKRGNDLVNIVDDIMEISMIQAGAVKPEYEEVPINVLIDSIYEEYASQISMGSRNINLKAEKRIFGRKFVIHSDGNILKQIFNKLIDNSVKFTAQGQITFGYRLNKDDEIVFYVSDTGIGILPEKQKLIFDLFRTGDDSSTRMHDGLGLGLCIVNELISLLGGDIWLSSIPGKGTDMYFSIPFERIGTSNKLTDSANKNRNLFPGKKILIVEDDPINNYFMKEVLEAAQVELLFAGDGKKAIEILESTSDIDLVFLDLNLPYYSGEEVLKRIRKTGNYVKVVIQSAFTTDAYNIPPDHYTYFLSKPLKPGEIYGALQKYL